jgi:hypothetical protein
VPSISDVFLSLRIDRRKVKDDVQAGLDNVDTSKPGRAAGERFAREFTRGGRKTYGAAGDDAGKAWGERFAASVQKAVENKRLNRSLGPSLLGFGAALSPAGIPLLGGLAAGVGAIGASFGAAGVAAGLFGVLAKSALTDASKSATGLQAAQDALHAGMARNQAAYAAAMAKATTGAQRHAAAIALANANAKTQLAYTQAVDKATQDQNATQVKFTMTMLAFQDSWKKTQSAIAPVVAGALTPWLAATTRSMRLLLPLVTPVAKVFLDWGQTIDKYLASGTGSREVTRIATAFGRFSASQLRDVGKFTGDIALGVFHLGQDAARDHVNFRAFGDDIARWGTEFNRWSQSKKAREDVNRVLDWVRVNGKTTLTLLTGLGKSLALMAPGLGAAGQLELNAITKFVGFISGLPKGVAQPLLAIAGGMLLLSKTGVLSVGLKIVGSLASLFTGGAATLGGGTAAAEIEAAFQSGGATAAAEIRASFGISGPLPAGARAGAGAGAAGAGASSAAGLAGALGPAAIGVIIGAAIVYIGDKLSPKGTPQGRTAGAIAKTQTGLAAAPGVTGIEGFFATKAAALFSHPTGPGSAAAAVDAYTKAVRSYGLQAGPALVARQRLVDLEVREGHLTAPQAAKAVDAYGKAVSASGVAAARTTPSYALLMSSTARLAAAAQATAVNFVRWSQQAGLSAGQAGKLWRELRAHPFDFLSGKVNVNRAAFEKLTARFGISKAAADKLWAGLRQTSLDALTAKAGTDRAAFVKLTDQFGINKVAANLLWSQLRAHPFNVLTGKASTNRAAFEKLAAQYGITKGEADRLWAQLRKQALDSVTLKATTNRAAFEKLSAQFGVNRARVDALWAHLRAHPFDTLTGKATTNRASFERLTAQFGINKVAADKLWAKLRQEQLTATRQRADAVTRAMDLLHGRVGNLRSWQALVGFLGGSVHGAIIGTIGDIAALARSYDGTAKALGLKAVPISTPAGLGVAIHSSGKGPGGGRQLATGGRVGTGWAPGHDTVHAVLSEGEFVMNPRAAKAIGYDNLHRLNSTWPVHAATGGQLVGQAIKYLGHPYTWGGSPPGAFDCSSFVNMILDMFHVMVPGGWHIGQGHGPNTGVWMNAPYPHVGFSAMRPGDIFVHGANPDHMGFVVAPGKGFAARGRSVSPQTGYQGIAPFYTILRVTNGVGAVPTLAGFGPGGGGVTPAQQHAYDASSKLFKAALAGKYTGPLGDVRTMMLHNTASKMQASLTAQIQALQAAASGAFGGNPIGGGPLGGATGSNFSNGVELYNYLLTNLFSGHRIAAAGATASIWGESNWNPFAQGTGGRGLIGWTPPGTISDAAFRGGMRTQLPAIIDFVRRNGDQGAIQQMLGSRSVSDAAWIWGRRVERFGIPDVHSAGIALATQIMNQTGSAITHSSGRGPGGGHHLAGGGRVRRYFNGGVIGEPVLGVGLRSGDGYSFAEHEAEEVRRLGRGGSNGLTIRFGDVHVREAADVELIAQRVAVLIDAEGFSG